MPVSKAGGTGKAAPARRPTAKNKTAKRARRVAIAKGLVEQRTPKAIAKDLGVSRKTVYQEIRQPETQELIRAWMRDYHGEIRELIPLALTTVKDGLAPLRKVNGMRVPADMVDRLRAVKVLGTVMGWAQGKTDANSESPINLKFSGTMEELLVVYRTLTSGQPPAQGTRR